MHDQASLPIRDSSRKPEGGRPDFPARLLVDLPNWLGDLVMALPATDRLMTANRRGKTILHVRDAAARLVSAIFPEAEVIASRRRENPIRTMRRLRGAGPRLDIGLTMRNASRAKVLLRLVSRWSAGTGTQGGRSLLSWVYQPESGRHQRHDADAALVRLGLEGADERWRAVMPESLLGSGRRALRDAGLDPRARAVGLAPGVAWGGSAKRWSEESFGRLARLLKEDGFEPVVVIGPGEAELAQSVIRGCGFDLPIVAEKLDAAGLAAVLSGLSCLVGNDSGPAHLSSALGVPTVALFGPTDDRRTAPMMPEATVLSRRLECAPCGHSICPLEHQSCLRDITAVDVLHAVVDRFEGLKKVARV